MGTVKKSMVKAAALLVAVLLAASVFSLLAGSVRIGGAAAASAAQTREAAALADGDVAAHWIFQNNDESRTGTLEDKDLIILDQTGNGNDLELQFYGTNANPSLESTANLSWSGNRMLPALRERRTRRCTT